MNSCFFIGHREASEDILPTLTEAVKPHIVDYGVTEFIVGSYGGFDRMAAKAVISAKALHPGITLFLLLPYHPAECPIEMPPGMELVPRRYAIVKANRYMVAHVDCLIAYLWHPASNARDLTMYAQRKGIIVTKLAKNH